MSASANLVKPNRLKGLLEEEFEALKRQDLERFELLQAEKASLLTDLEALGSRKDLDQEFHESFKSVIYECKALHQRNHLLIQRKLDAIRGTINALHAAQGLGSVEIYDKLGRISGGVKNRGLGEA